MTIDRRLIALVAVVIFVWAWAGVTRAQDLSTWSVCGFELGVDVRLRTKAPEAVTVLTLKCGEYVRVEAIEGCVFVTAFNERDDLVSVTVGRSYPLEDCQPVPEPRIGMGLAIGAMAILVVFRRGERLGRS